MSPQAYQALGQAALGIYAALLIAGGLMGYVKARSRPSLIAGVVGGLLALVALGLTFVGTMGASGFWVGAIAAGLLLAVFVVRFLKTRKFMPSGLLMGVSAAVLVLQGLAIAHRG